MPVLCPQYQHFGGHFGFLEYEEAILDFKNDFILSLGLKKHIIRHQYQLNPTYGR